MVVRWFSFVLLLVSMLFSHSVMAVSYEQQPVVDKIRSYSEIAVKIRPAKIQLGQPISVIIEGEDIAESVSQIDWSEFKKHFIIDSTDQGSSLFRAKLFPLKTGELMIPAQRAGVVNIPAVKIEVSENPNVKVEWQPPATQLYSQQQANWQAQVMVSNPAFLVSIEKPEKQPSEGVVVHLGQTSVNATDQTNSAPRIVGAAYEMPSLLKPAELQIASPIVTVKNTGNRLWKFFDQSQLVAVQPLPNFLPMSVAVGQIDWQVEPLNSFYQVDGLHYWQWQLSAYGMTADYLKGAAYRLLDQLSQSSDVSWLSESMQVETSFDHKGMQTTLTVEVPYRIEQAGLIDFKAITLRYFDPLNGRVNQQSFASTWLLAVPNWLAWLSQWLLLSLLLLVLFVSLFVLKQVWYNRQFKQNLKQAEDAVAIWQVMLIWKNQQSWYRRESKTEINKALTTSHGLWLEWYRLEFGKTQQQLFLTQQLLEQLSVAMFANAQIEQDNTQLMELKSEWLRQQSIWPNFCQIRAYLLSLWKRLRQKFA